MLHSLALKTQYSHYVALHPEALLALVNARANQQWFSHPCPQSHLFHLAGGDMVQGQVALEMYDFH